MLEEVNLRGAGLRFAKLQDCVLEGANLRGADLWGAFLNDAVAPSVDFWGATLKEADLRGADLSESNFRQATLSSAQLAGAKLRGADLRRAKLAGADLSGADLRDAKLQGLDLVVCRIAGSRLSGAWLDKTRIARDQIGEAVGEEVAGEYDDARKAYLALERHFQELGDLDASSWAYRRKRRMHKLDSLQRARVARAAGERRAAFKHYSNYASDQAVEWICDYGESLPRILRLMGVVYVAFAVLYGLTGSVVQLVDIPGESGTIRLTTRSPIDLAIFSLFAMVSPSDPPVGLEAKNEFVHLLIGLQSLIGIMLTGLLGFVMGNLVRR